MKYLKKGNLGPYKDYIKRDTMTLELESIPVNLDNHTIISSNKSAKMLKHYYLTH